MGSKRKPWDGTYYFQSLTNLSWLAEATKPATPDTAKEAINPSWPVRVIVLFSFMFHSSKDCKMQFICIRICKNYRSSELRDSLSWTMGTQDSNINIDESWEYFFSSVRRHSYLVPILVDGSRYQVEVEVRTRPGCHRYKSKSPHSYP